VKGRLFRRGDYVAIGASGGKDSTVLAYVMKKLNDEYDYGLQLVLLSIGNCQRISLMHRNLCALNTYGIPLVKDW
jgi:tRNA(Ile)-lysidine synthase TilS/MesJ